MLEVRCPACVDLGYSIARLVFVVHGEMTVPETPVWFQFHCKRCHSNVQWSYGMNTFQINKLGVKNHKQQKAAFE